MNERFLDEDSGDTYKATLTAIPDFPEVSQGDNIASIVLEKMAQLGTPINNGDVFAFAHKIISKAEGRLINLSQVKPSPEAIQVAADTEKDPRLIEMILQESQEISRIRPGLIIVKHRLGFICANAGIDRSNVPQGNGEETVILLPLNPDESARIIRQSIGEETNKKVGVVIVDSHGRPFRLGTVGMAIGAAGIPTLWDRRDEPDLYGYELQHTEVGTADEIAAAASLLMGQAAEGTPAVHINGLRLPPSSGTAAELVRPKEKDLYP